MRSRSFPWREGKKEKDKVFTFHNNIARLCYVYTIQHTAQWWFFLFIYLFICIYLFIGKFYFEYIYI